MFEATQVKQWTQTFAFYLHAFEKETAISYYIQVIRICKKYFSHCPIEHGMYSLGAHSDSQYTQTIALNKGCPVTCGKYFGIMFRSSK